MFGRVKRSCSLSLPEVYTSGRERERDKLTSSKADNTPWTECLSSKRVASIFTCTSPTKINKPVLTCLHIKRSCVAIYQFLFRALKRQTETTSSCTMMFYSQSFKTSSSSYLSLRVASLYVYECM